MVCGVCGGVGSVGAGVVGCGVVRGCWVTAGGGRRPGRFRVASGGGGREWLSAWGGLRCAPFPLDCGSHLPPPACPPAEADRDGDGEVNEEEFARIMKKTSLFG